MKKRIFISAVIAMLMSFALVFTACDGLPTTRPSAQFEAPTGLTVCFDSMLATWNPVEDSMKYTIRIEGEGFLEVRNTARTTFNLASLHGLLPATAYYVSVMTRARGANNTTTDVQRIVAASVFSEPVIFHNGRNINFVYYSDFGAVGDGAADDSQAIVDAHDHANRNNMPVRADSGKKFLFRANRTAVIQTDTDWQDAEIIIDNSNVGAGHTTFVFNVTSSLTPTTLGVGGNAVTSLYAGQTSLGRTFDYDSFIHLIDNSTPRFIRRTSFAANSTAAWNTNLGVAQADVIIVDKDGNVDPSTPILWDFNDISMSHVRPIDPVPLTLRGGIFTTISNEAGGLNGEAGRLNLYYNRGIGIERSNTVVYGVTHYVSNNDVANLNSPYNGFIVARDCAKVTVMNSRLTARRNTVHGTYDISAIRVANFYVIDTVQTNYISSPNYWGIFASNFCKNIVFDGVEFSRFDAHMGVHNTTIINSSLGRMGLQIIGTGLLHIENTTIINNNFINLRQDYGSTWNGDILIRNSEFRPTGANATLIMGRNDGDWDFGYICYMPRNIVIDGLSITGEIGSAPNNFRLFANTFVHTASPGANPPILFPAVLTDTIRIGNLTRINGSGFVRSINAGQYEDIIITIL